MPTETEALALGYAQRHPEAVARLLDGMTASNSASVLQQWPTAAAANVLSRMTPIAGAALVAQVSPGTAAGWLASTTHSAAAALLRPLPASPREAILAAMPDADLLRTILQHPPDTAAAVMRSDVLHMRSRQTAAAAIDLIRTETGRLAAFLYVVDDAHLLVGGISVRRLLTAEPTTELRELAESATDTLPAATSLLGVARHPGWLVVHELPVCDPDGTFLGVIDYPTLRRIEAALRQGARAKEAASNTAAALGDLFSVGVYGVLEGAFGNLQKKESARDDA